MRMNITTQSFNILPVFQEMMHHSWYVSHLLRQRNWIHLLTIITLITPYIWNHIYSITDDNKTLAPRCDIGWQFFDTMVRDHIVQYNYTLNPEGIFGAIKYMYTYYPDPNNRSHIREEFINVSMNWDLFSWFVVEVWILMEHIKGLL